MTEDALDAQAAKAYEKHCQEQGKPANHKVAVELLCALVTRLIYMMLADHVHSAALTGGFVDRLVETKGVSCGGRSWIHYSSDPVYVVAAGCRQRGKGQARC